MFYRFCVETLGLVNGNYEHCIIKEASSRNEAFLQIVQDAILKGLTIESITFYGQYTKMPNNSKSTF
jgi:hypothetical protein